ncbi:MAG: DNA-protecting protein DprA [Bacilli bacterium]|nr:DNA-protecting protein DprA [Bacilli bacterium]
MEGREILVYLSIKYDGDWNKIITAIKEKESVDLKVAKEEVSKIKDKYITCLDDDYPRIFKEGMMSCLPLVLFYRGDLSLITTDRKRLTVIGSRKYSRYGEKATRDLVSALSDDIVIVSGLATGIDAISMETALNSNKKVIGIIGGGFNKFYPPENKDLFERIIKEGGLVLSEYPPDSPPTENYFRLRNRLLAAASQATLVTEAKIISGTKITVGFALQYGRNVGCVPYPYYTDSLCNVLIQQGANVILNKNDLEEML